MQVRNMFSFFKRLQHLSRARHYAGPRVSFNPHDNRKRQYFTIIISTLYTRNRGTERVSNRPKVTFLETDRSRI